MSEAKEPTLPENNPEEIEYQYGVEMQLPDSSEAARSTAWVARLPAVVSALNNEVTRQTGRKPAEAIKAKAVSAKPSTPYSRPVGLKEKKLPSGVKVCYLYQPGELEGGGKKSHRPNNLVFESLQT